MSRLNGKVSIITGAAGGIGKATAKKFAQEGCKVVLTDVDYESVLKIKDDIVFEGFDAVAVVHDVSSEKDWKNVIDKTLQQYDYVNVLINNAGIGDIEGILDTNLDQWERVQAINLRSVFLGMKYVIPEMKKVKGGSIINISSIYAMIGEGRSAAYHASKAGIMGLTKTAAVELAKDYVRVNTIHPGVIETPMNKEIIEDKKTKNELNNLTPWPIFGEPKDIAYGALYLASDESKFVTGSQLVIDGGYTAK
ncbi:glucose 1-dehydrogenase [Bacillus sp. FJAT-29790]|uniref:SDR family NAD(P)-dependent oxidoreductase n=1 Tax=Bacillus sp. FJAT-29790 TaxID=1895002 RepID=UPI001C2498C4|nr:glucose 1-dehydrogenase [Bacillus sp. FJAT-29790]MBU8877521.1 glucose 1-dehydrogenase [Bacillus sp. FJAT-29790]